MKKLFLIFILSIPVVVIGAFVFKDIGGLLLISWFSLVLGLILTKTAST
ncbi:MULTISPECIES: hypothetical protein [Shewanella]